MKECDNSAHKIHISYNFLMSIILLIMVDTLLLRPSLHCNTLLHFTTLHPTTLHHTSPNYTYWHFTFFHLHVTTLSFSFTIYISYHSVSPHITKLDTVQFSSPNLRQLSINGKVVLKWIFEIWFINMQIVLKLHRIGFTSRIVSLYCLTLWFHSFGIAWWTK
jgi:hypothetical protein